MKKITGIISIFGATVWIVAVIYFSREVYLEKDKDSVLPMIGVFIFCSSVIYFCFTSKFWKSDPFATKILVNAESNNLQQVVEKQVPNTSQRRYRGLRNLATFSNSISVIALLISALSIYFQFFNEIHTVLYSSLTPGYNQKTKQIIVPIIFKNTGNQTEVILDSQLELEEKEADKSFFKKISSLEINEGYIVLSPGENKKIDLVGDYENYFLGTIRLQIQTNSYSYSSISVFDSLRLKIKITYLTEYGSIAFEEREIGNVSFNKDQSIKKIEYHPIELKNLELDKVSQVVNNSIIPDTHHIPLKIFKKDSSMNLEKLKKIFDEGNN